MAGGRPSAFPRNARRNDLRPRPEVGYPRRPREVHHEARAAYGALLVLALLIRANRAKQRLLACGLSEHYRQIFELTRLNDAIGIYPDEAAALRAA